MSTGTLHKGPLLHKLRAPRGSLGPRASHSQPQKVR